MTTDAFVTASGTHVPAVTAETMRDADRIAVEDVGLELLQMMENAGRTLAHRVAATGDEPVVVVAGNGGNGGGGLACARHLHNHDVRVAVVLDRDPDALTGAAAQQYRVLDATDIPVTSGVEGLAAFDRIGVIVDALIGYGLDGPVRDPARSLVERMNRRDSGVPRRALRYRCHNRRDARHCRTPGDDGHARVTEDGAGNLSGTARPRRYRNSAGRVRPSRHHVRRPVRTRVVGQADARRLISDLAAGGSVSDR